MKVCEISKKELNDYGYTICDAIEELFNDERYTEVRASYCDDVRGLRISIEDNEDMFNNVYIKVIGDLVALHIVYYSLDSDDAYLTDMYNPIRDMNELASLIAGDIYNHIHGYYERGLEA